MSDSPNDEKLRSDLESLRIQSSARSRQKKGGSRNRWLLGGAAILLAAILAWGFSGEPQRVEVGYARVSSGQASSGAPLLSGSGYVISDSYISVGSRIPGRIEKYFVTEGQEVEEGEPKKRAEISQLRGHDGAALHDGRGRRARPRAGPRPWPRRAAVLRGFERGSPPPSLLRPRGNSGAR